MNKWDGYKPGQIRYESVESYRKRNYNLFHKFWLEVFQNYLWKFGPTRDACEESLRDHFQLNRDYRGPSTMLLEDFQEILEDGITEDNNLEQEVEGDRTHPHYWARIIYKPKLEAPFYSWRYRPVTPFNRVTGDWNPERLSVNQVDWLMERKRNLRLDGRINEIDFAYEMRELAKLRSKAVTLKWFK